MLVSLESVAIAIILRAAAEKVDSELKLRKIKREFAPQLGGKVIRNSALLAAYQALVESKKLAASPGLQQLFLKRPVRSLSGVSVITVLTRDFGCPARCVYCPTEKGMPKSYLSREPGVLRAVKNKFDPYRQVQSRLEALAACGHPVGKIELIILGGTWTALPRWYQTYFVRRLFEALNDGLENSPKKKAGLSLSELQKVNETARHRCVGLTVETRPDWLDPEEIQRQLKLGVTRFELGVQTLDDEIQRKTKRGHFKKDAENGIKLLKDAGLKVGIHIMPGLPGATAEGDKAMLAQIFEDSMIRPDQMKVYPCMVTPHTELAKWWQRGEFEPYSTPVVAEILAAGMRATPEYCRLVRIVRDIPGTQILAGSQVTNLRQLIEQSGAVARDIRARELKGESFDAADVRLVERPYEASGGQELFLSFEDTRQDKLIAFARLRLQADGRLAFVRELHSYGQEQAIGRNSGAAGQHRGYGRQLLARAEEIAKSRGYRIMKIPAGVGTREYYRKFGYELSGPYMAKKLLNSRRPKRASSSVD